MRAGAVATLLLAAWAQGAPQARPRVLVAPYSGVISPVAAEFISAAVERGEAGGYSAVILELDTPGGLDASMRQIVQAVLNAKVPVVVYVYPPGARATSAGVFVAMAAHVVAMAPGTNIGAAHPVLVPTGIGSTGVKEGEKNRTLEEKAANDAAAYLQAIAHERGRNEAWAFEAVTRSTSIPAVEAVRSGVADLVAADLGELLRLLDGRKAPGASGPLRTSGAETERFEMTRRQRILSAISDPNVAMILMSLGVAGVFIELYNPGLILPGVVGAISLILAFYSFQTLTASYAGLSLILFGMLLFILEIKVTSYGMLALGGAASSILGTLMLFRHQSAWGLGVSWGIMASSLAGMLGVAALCSYLVYAAYGRKAVTGPEGMAGALGETVTELSPRGKVRIHGELWDAVSSGGGVPAGRPVVVEAVEGLALRVRPYLSPPN